MKITDAYNLFMTAQVGEIKPITIRWYADRIPRLIKYLGDKKISEITLTELRAWRAELITCGISDSYAHGILRAAKRFFTWCVEEEMLAISPAHKLKLGKPQRKLPRGISKSARDLIIEQARKGDSARDLAIVLMLADTACRVGGIAHLTVKDLDLSRRRAIVTEKGPGNGKRRPVFFMAQTARALAAWLVERGEVEQLEEVFIGQRMGREVEPLTENGIYQAIKRLAKKAGVKSGWNPHNWRHGAIRGMIDNKLPLPIVSQLAGHSSVNVTADIYGLYPENDLQEFHDAGSWIAD